jgi:hypothetical protein
MFALFLCPGWTRLPFPPDKCSIGNRRNLCAGCRLPLGRTEAQFCCQFCDSGFVLDGTSLRPCRTRYHPHCLRIGLPFRSRLAKDAGLRCPKGAELWDNFICEACTVRSVRRRELTRTSEDKVLLMLERARLIDLTNHWATGTMKTYSSKYRILRAFEHDLDLSVLDVTPISAPPNGPAIKLMWAQERYALYPARWRRNQKEASETVKFGTIRALRSAASHHWVWDLLHTRPHRLTTGHKNKPIVVDGCSPTDELAFTFFADGMKRRLGDHSKPAVPLLDCHVRFLRRQRQLC